MKRAHMFSLVGPHLGRQLWQRQRDDGTPLETLVAGSSPYAMAFDGTHMWVANFASRMFSHGLCEVE